MIATCLSFLNLKYAQVLQPPLNHIFFFKFYPSFFFSYFSINKYILQDGFRGSVLIPKGKKNIKNNYKIKKIKSTRLRIEPPSYCVTSKYSNLLDTEASLYREVNNQNIRESRDLMKIK